MKVSGRSLYSGALSSPETRSGTGRQGGHRRNAGMLLTQRLLMTGEKRRRGPSVVESAAEGRELSRQDTGGLNET